MVLKNLFFRKTSKNLILTLFRPFLGLTMPPFSRNSQKRREYDRTLTRKKSLGDKMLSYVKERFKIKPPTNACHDAMPAVHCYIMRFRWGYCGSPLPHFTKAQTTWQVNYGKRFSIACPYTCEFC
jgi:hypothetical protein